MTNLIKRSNEQNTLINLFNVDYKATEQDIRDMYTDVSILDINQIKPGLFILELRNDEALKLVDIGAKVLKMFSLRNIYRILELQW